MNNMAMVNVNNLLNIKDSRWLQLEVCREFQRNKCSRPDTECKFAHPPANVEVQNGRVTACYDSIKGRCNREKPPCKYFHPPLHLKDQLLINGRNHLALKNALMQQMGLAPGQPVVPGQVPAVATNPYLGVTSQAYNPYFAAGPLVPLVSDPTGGGVVSPLGVPQQTVVAQQKVPRDRLETYPGMVAYKRPAGDKSGVPVYQPANTSSAAAYQHLMQLQQPFVPVSSNSIQHNSGGSGNASGIPSSSAQDPTNSGLSNGSLDSHGLGNESPIKRQLKQDVVDENDLLDGSNLASSSQNDLDDDTKESALKRMRVNAGTNSQASLTSNVAVSSAAALAQNNAAYVAAAQSYHNALAAINYTGVALQTNKAQQSANQNVGQQHGFTGAPAFQHQSHAGALQQQQNQQQQLLSQYQAMAAAALANQGAFQGQLGVPQPGVQQQQQQNLNMNMNAAAAQAAGLNPFAAAAAMNPLLAASLPQIAAAQRASMLQAANQQQAGGMNPNQFNPNALAAAGMNNAGAQNQAAAVAGFNPFGVQFGGPGGAAGAAAALPFQQNQQALLAAYGQFGRGHVPVAVSAASTMASQQLAFVGNPAAAAVAAAAAAGGGGAVQQGLKRMRPN